MTMTQPPAGGALDRFRRPLASLRLSVTDRCNLRCRYCMPEEEYVWLPRASILTFEETERLVAIFTGLGTRRVRITGGEPLLRHDLPALVERLAQVPGVDDLALTTNGLLLARSAAALRAAGLPRVTVSLDTLRPERFAAFARSHRHGDVLAGLDAAVRAGFEVVKLNAVVIRGFNDDEILDLLRFGRDRGVEVRFIEYMDVGGATRWSRDDVVSREEILGAVRDGLGAVRPLAGRDAAPADRYALPDGTAFGVVASTTAPFCGSCDRSRLTADGMWLTCLYADAGVDLKRRLREGATDDALRETILATWRARADRGAEERLRVAARGPLYQLGGLRADPHREMHTRGG